MYGRFRERGRLLPPGVAYVTSWVTDDLNRCYQVMEAADRAALDPWLEHWADVADFEVIPVLTSEAAAQQVP